MKHFPFLLIVCSVFVFGIMASGCSKDLNYIKACEEKDWAKAYAIVDELESNAHEKELVWREAQNDHGTESSAQVGPHRDFANSLEKAVEANKYVVFHEAMYVLEENGENGLMRIAGIIKEHDAKWLYRELIDVARKAGYKDLEERFLEMEIIEIKKDKTDFDDLSENEKEEYRVSREKSWENAWKYR